MQSRTVRLPQKVRCGGHYSECKVTAPVMSRGFIFLCLAIQHIHHGLRYIFLLNIMIGKAHVIGYDMSHTRYTCDARNINRLSRLFASSDI